jgi:hypothetical protein
VREEVEREIVREDSGPESLTWGGHHKEAAELVQEGIDHVFSLLLTSEARFVEEELHGGRP